MADSIADRTEISIHEEQRGGRERKKTADSTEVAANNGMPGGVVLFVEFLLDVGGDILLDAVLSVTRVLECNTRDRSGTFPCCFKHGSNAGAVLIMLRLWWC
jgi:hypothetical protein